MRKGKSGGTDAPQKASYDEWSNEMLMKAYAAQGDSAAFEVLYGRTSNRVYGYLNQRLKDRGTVDDVFQGTYLKLHDTRSKYDPKYPFEPWLFTVCRSVLVDVCRKRGRSLEDLHQEAADSELVADPSETIPHSDLPELTALPENQRRAVELRYMEELPFEEIAERLETSPANIRQMISRAVKRLRMLVRNNGESL